MPFLDFVCKSHKGSKFVLVDDPKPTRGPVGGHSQETNCSCWARILDGVSF